ncbi:MAG: hypothetical protein U9O94_05545 [Nanoarchaeota archaeon]|nr:hypothetical protein [Nanoarchaeota archaeon]
MRRIEASLPVGLVTLGIIVTFGLVVYSLVAIRKKVKEKLIELMYLKKEIKKKNTGLKKLTKELTKARNGLKAVSDFKKLRETLKEEKVKSKELNNKVRNLESKSKKLPRIIPPVQKPMVMSKGIDDRLEKIRRKYPALPKNQLERIEIERAIARALMRNGGSFHISQVLRKVEGIYTKHIKPTDRIMLLNEIKSWIERDPLCKAASTKDNVQHYTFI